MKSVTKAVVPAAGLGKRMRPLTYGVPKELLPLGSRPVLHYVLEELIQAGMLEICIVTSPRKPTLLRYIQAISWPVEITWVEQREEKGLGDALQWARSFTQEQPFVVALGDCTIDSSEELSPLQRMLERYQQTGHPCVLVEEVPLERVKYYGIVVPAEEPGDAFLLKGLVEKPHPEKAPSCFASAARYLLTPEIWEWLARAPERDGEIGLADALGAMMSAGHPCDAVQLKASERRWDIGGFPTYFEAFAVYAARDPLGKKGEQS